MKNNKQIKLLAISFRHFIVRNASTETKTNIKYQYKLKQDYSGVVKAAEKVVGYPTSFLNLRWLLNDEIANIAMHLRKLIGTNHPLLKTAKNFLLKNEVPAWGLVVLLMSKVAGFKTDISKIDHDKNAGILHSQRVLAEVTEMIRTSMLIHKGLINVDPQSELAQDLYFGNKIALLSGDYLISKSFNDLANLKNHHVNEIYSSTLRDFSENEFLGPRDLANNPLPSNPNKNFTSSNISDPNNTDYGPYDVDQILGNSRDEWFLRSILGGANLLAKSCKSTLVLSGHNEEMQDQAFMFGKHIALTWQAKLDYDNFLKNQNKFNLVGAPVLLHLSHNPNLYEDILKGINNIENCDFKKIHSLVSRSGALEETKELQKEMAERALKNLSSFSDSDAKEALKNMVSAV